MFEIKGKYTKAISMIDEVEDVAISQIINICSQEFAKDYKIAIMPDVHAGKGCVIGFTAEISKEDPHIVPNLVGVDISCSVSGYNLGNNEIDLEKLNHVIQKRIPSGTGIRNNASDMIPDSFMDRLKTVAREINCHGAEFQRFVYSLGTLGGGNHFIAVEKDENGDNWLLIHCGSRNFGKKICEFHQKIAIKYCKERVHQARKEVLSKFRPEEREEALKKLTFTHVPDELAYLRGKKLDLYINHVLVAEEYAKLNHEIIAHEIISSMGFNVKDKIFTNHNYIENKTDKYIIRKGSISAYEDERVIIPISMQYGSFIGKCKGNPDWNYSAPHGAGRIMSRSQAKSTIKMEDFIESMKGIYSTCISENTKDEACFAYKDPNAIKDNISETVDIIHHIKPIYNYKSN